MKVLVIALATLLTGCYVEDRSPQPSYGAQVEQRDWVYYPDHDVYYDSGHREWAYQREGRWERNQRLPQEYAVAPSAVSVRLNVRDDHPYDRHEEHRAAYPRGWRPHEERH